MYILYLCIFCIFSYVILIFHLFICGTIGNVYSFTHAFGALGVESPRGGAILRLMSNHEPCSKYTDPLGTHVMTCNDGPWWHSRHDVREAAAAAALIGVLWGRSWSPGWVARTGHKGGSQATQLTARQSRQGGSLR